MATALSFEERQMDTLRQQQLQVTHPIGEAGGVNHSALTHKLDDAMVGRRDMEVTLTDAEGRVLYASSSVPDRVLERLARTLIAAALAGAVVIAIGGYTLVQVGLGPVRDLSSQIQALDADTLHQHLDGSAQPDELVPLVTHVNGLLIRLHKAYEQLEAFNADVAHELFTPLATLMGSTEIALRKARDVDTLRDVLGTHLEEMQRMSMIVQESSRSTDRATRWPCVQ